eukprot:TRINITY_DN7092_c1_g1_i2.p1 TRINITY_DN7092_c1_g1~~TRINITY_DN7092_c1_g1_i2.p1  ORF type:complete len:1097 (+),score=323.95 TRINITY_DN7092_c1_g1_i2:57-3293(+)
MEGPPGAFDQGPPSLSEPLLTLKTSSLNSTISWVHGVVSALATSLQAEHEQRERETQELRGQCKQLLERIHGLESRSYISAPAEPAQSRPSGLAAPEFAEQLRKLEESFTSLREQQVLSKSTQDDLLLMRLDAIDLELQACLRPKDLEGHRQEIQDARTHLDRHIDEKVRSLGQELRANMQKGVGDIHNLLKESSAPIAERLQICEDRLSELSLSATNQAEDAAGRDKTPIGGAGNAGGASMESRVARLERDLKKAIAASGSPSPVVADSSVVEERTEEPTHSRSGSKGAIGAAEQAQKAAEDAKKLAASLEARLADVDVQLRRLSKNAPVGAADVASSADREEAPLEVFPEAVEGRLQRLEQRMQEQLEQWLQQQQSQQQSQQQPQQQPPQPPQAPSPSAVAEGSAALEQKLLEVAGQLQGQDGRMQHVEGELNRLQQFCAPLRQSGSAGQDGGDGGAQIPPPPTSMASPLPADDSAVEVLTTQASATSKTLAEHGNELQNLSDRIQGLQETLAALSRQSPEAAAALAEAAGDGAGTVGSGSNIEERLSAVEQKLEGLGTATVSFTPEEHRPISPAADYQVDRDLSAFEVDRDLPAVDEIDRDLPPALQEPDGAGIEAEAPQQTTTSGEAVSSATAAAVDAIAGRTEKVEKSLSKLLDQVKRMGKSMADSKRLAEQANAEAAAAKATAATAAAAAADASGSANESKTEPSGQAQDSDAARAQRQAVAAVAARAAQLEEQLDQSNGEDTAMGAASSGRLAALEGRVESLAESLESVRQRHREALLEAASASPSPAMSPEEKEELRAAAAAAAAAQASAAAAHDSAAGQAQAHEVLSLKVQDLAVGLRAVEEGRLKDLGADLKALREAVVQVQREQNKEVVIPQKTLDELDQKSETRLAAVWKELHSHAEAAAVRADQMERNLTDRLEKVEVTAASFKEAEAASKAMEQNLLKQIEWLNWRISWLEWATNGEKRSFSRVVDSRSVLPLPPPATAAATCFKQPITEDCELWARDVGGRQRMRRRINSPLPPGDSRVGTAQTSSGSSLGVSGGGLGPSSSAPDLGVGAGGSSSRPRLPQVR